MTHAHIRSSSLACVLCDLFQIESIESKTLDGSERAGLHTSLLLCGLPGFNKTENSSTLLFDAAVTTTTVLVKWFNGPPSSPYHSLWPYRTLPLTF